MTSSVLLLMAFLTGKRPRFPTGGGVGSLTYSWLCDTLLCGKSKSPSLFTTFHFRKKKKDKNYFYLSFYVFLTHDTMTEIRLDAVLRPEADGWMENSDTKHWLTTSFRGSCRKAMLGSVCRTRTPSTGLRHSSFLGGSCRKVMLGVPDSKLQALVYDILPSLEEAAGKRCSECVQDSKLQALVYDILPWRKLPESNARSVCVQDCSPLIPPPLPSTHTYPPRPPSPTPILTHLEAGPGAVYLLAIFLPLGEGRGVGLHGTHQLRVLAQLGRVPVLGLAAQLGGTCTCNTHKQ